jgi:hypothetical protein
MSIVVLIKVQCWSRPVSNEQLFGFSMNVHCKVFGRK